MAVQGNGNGNGRRVAPPPARKNDATPQVGLPGLFAGPVASPPPMPETQVEPVPNARDDSPPVEVGVGTTLQEPAPVAPPDAPEVPEEEAGTVPPDPESPTFDPRGDDLRADSKAWSILLGTAWCFGERETERTIQLFSLLHGFRCGGLRLLNRSGKVVMEPTYAPKASLLDERDGKTYIHDSVSAWATEREWYQSRAALLPFRTEVKVLLANLEEWNPDILAALPHHGRPVEDDE
jgi:hypothetical protein